MGSEIWRLELALLGVRTITVMTGSVRSGIFGNLPGREVLEDSYYAEIGKDIYDMGDGRLADHACSAEAWATKVVAAVEKGTVGKVWFGGGASATAWGIWLLPGWVLVSYCLVGRA